VSSLRVGLTGGIGAGKSEVSRRLESYGAVVIDADQVAREVVAPGNPGLAEVVAAFGEAVLTPDGGLDRERLGEIVFADESLRAKLNAIVHPLVGRRMRELERAAGEAAIVVHDIPLLAENHHRRGQLRLPGRTRPGSRGPVGRVAPPGQALGRARGGQPRRVTRRLVSEPGHTVEPAPREQARREHRHGVTGWPAWAAEVEKRCSGAAGKRS